MSIKIVDTNPKKPRRFKYHAPPEPVGHSPELYQAVQGSDWKLVKPDGGRDYFVCDSVIQAHRPGIQEESFVGKIRLVAYDRPTPHTVEVEVNPDHPAIVDDDDYQCIVDGVGTDTFGALDDWIETLGGHVWLDVEPV